LDVFEAIVMRSSTRSFKNVDVKDEDVKKLIDAARHAPSAGNIQPWEFVVVRDREVKRDLAAAALDQSFIEEAPIVIVVCADQRRSSRGYGNRGATLYCIQDTAAATQNMLLAAYALGLGACWVGAFHEEEVKSVLRIPDGIRPVAIVPVGYPAEKPEPRYKRPLQEIIHHESFQEQLGKG